MPQGMISKKHNKANGPSLDQRKRIPIDTRSKIEIERIIIFATISLKVKLISYL